MTAKKKPAPAAVDERSLPANLEAERSVLGAVLVHNDALDAVYEAVRPTDFYRDAHRRIYEAMLRLFDRKTTVDFVTVKEELARVGDLDDVGGPAYIASLVDGVPRAINAKYYAGIVREKAMLRNIITAANRVLTDAYLAEQPAAVVLADADRAFIDLTADGARHIRTATLKSTMGQTFARLEHRHEHRGELLGITTGFASLDEQTLGWQSGDLIIVAARPSVGKTAFTLNAMAASAATGARWVMFSLEMKREHLEDRILAALAGVDAQRIRSGHLGAADFSKISEAIERMANLPITIDDRSGLTAVQIRQACRRIKSESGLDAVAVDYAQLMKGCLQKRDPTRNEELTDAITRLKDMADELGVPALVLSQLARKGKYEKDPRPQLDELRDSGAIEQAADVVIGLHRPNYRESGTTEALFLKQRNGPTGTRLTTFDRDTQTFTDGGDPLPEPGRRRGQGKAAPPEPEGEEQPPLYDEA